MREPKNPDGHDEPSPGEVPLVSVTCQAKFQQPGRSAEGRVPSTGRHQMSVYAVVTTLVQRKEANRKPLVSLTGVDIGHFIKCLSVHDESTGKMLWSERQNKVPLIGLGHCSIV